MGSYAHLNREDCRWRVPPDDFWSQNNWSPTLGVKARSDAAASAKGETDLAAWTGTTERLVALHQHPASWRVNDGREEDAAEELIAGIRWAMEWYPEAARAAISQLVASLTPPGTTKVTGARGGLAPWQQRKVDRYLRDHLDEPMRLKAVAERVALSVSHFSRAFKESFGTTPHMHMVRLRLELACQLMLTTDDSLSQIALACGLADQAHLSKLFRRLMGETPNAWRRRNLTDAQAEARIRRSRLPERWVQRGGELPTSCPQHDRPVQAKPGSRHHIPC